MTAESAADPKRLISGGRRNSAPPNPIILPRTLIAAAAPNPTDAQCVERRETRFWSVVMAGHPRWWLCLPSTARPRLRGKSPGPAQVLSGPPSTGIDARARVQQRSRPRRHELAELAFLVGVQCALPRSPVKTGTERSSTALPVRLSRPRRCQAPRAERRGGSCGLVLSPDQDTVPGPGACPDQRHQVGSGDRPPAGLGGLDELEDHGDGCGRAVGAAGDLGSQLDRGEGRLDRRTSDASRRGPPRPRPSTMPSRRRRRPVRGRACRVGGSRAAGRPTTRWTLAAPRPARSTLRCRPSGRRAGPARTSAPGQAAPWDARCPPTRRQRHVGQVPVAGGGVVVLSLFRQPGRRRVGQLGRAAKEVFQCRDEVAAGQPVQVEQRQYLGNPRRFAAPRRHHLRGEPPSFAGGLIDPFVVHARGLDLNRARGGDHAAGRIAPVPPRSRWVSPAPAGRPVRRERSEGRGRPSVHTAREVDHRKQVLAQAITSPVRSPATAGLRGSRGR